MSRVAQARTRRRTGPIPAGIALLFASATLAGCGSFKLSKVDTDTLTTSAVAPERKAGPDTTSDETTIRNAVSSANLDELGATPLAWANVGTDSRGSVFDIAEVRDKSALCRTFKGSRESFDGVRLFNGEACMDSGGGWWMRKFEEN